MTKYEALRLQKIVTLQVMSCLLRRWCTGGRGLFISGLSLIWDVKGGPNPQYAEVRAEDRIHQGAETLKQTQL